MAATAAAKDLVVVSVHSVCVCWTLREHLCEARTFPSACIHAHMHRVRIRICRCMDETMKNHSHTKLVSAFASLAQVGSLNCDLVLPVNRVPQPGETLAANGMDTIPGGKVR